METWNDVLLAGIGIVFAVLTPIVPILALALYRWIVGKMKIERDVHIEAQVSDIASDAVAYAEQLAIAAAKADPLLVAPGHERMANAVTFAVAEVQRRGLPEIAQASLVQLIESRLGHVNRDAKAVGEPGVKVLEPPPGLPTP